MSRIDDLYARARRALATGESSLWEAAEAMAELAALGQSQRRIADQLGCSQKTVGRYLAVIRESARLSIRPPFAEAYTLANPDNSTGAFVKVPKAPEKRAELVAELLKDKTVADAPIIREAQQRIARRQMKEEAATFNREHDIKTRTEKERARRLTSVEEKQFFWRILLGDINEAIRKLGEATSEVERTGLPRKDSGEIIRKARALARAAERFEQAATSAGIGQAM
jgi:predicted transcriptional regulator